MSHHVQKAMLLKRLRELGVRLEGIEKALEAPHSKDWEEMAIEREDDEVLDQLGQTGQNEVRRIMNALNRMAKGEYGACLSCGEEISDERLMAVPETALCRTCAARQNT